jgi:hypothetical protein
MLNKHMTVLSTAIRIDSQTAYNIMYLVKKTVPVIGLRYTQYIVRDLSKRD